MDKRLSLVCCRVSTNVSKKSIHYSLMRGILVFLNLKLSTHFFPLFNCKVQIVIYHVFFDTLRISSYIKDFFN
jgi:hypothetical protein